MCFEDAKIPRPDATSEWNQDLGGSSLAVLAGIRQPPLIPDEVSADVDFGKFLPFLAAIQIIVMNSTCRRVTDG